MHPKFEELRKNWMDFEEFKARYQKVEVEEYPNNVIEAVPNPEISVHITTYQHAPYIREAIESVLMQKVDVPWEIIIGDDESTDGTREICIEYAKKYPDLIRLFLHKRENNIAVLGKPCGIFQIVYNTFNCRGKYKAVCGGDDKWGSEEKLMKQYDFLENNIAYSMATLPNKSIEVKDGKVVYGELRNKFKASSVMYKNYFSKLPKEFLSSLNEDMFFRAIAKINGKSAILKDAGIVYFNITGNNLWVDKDMKIRSLLGLNSVKHIYLAIGTLSFISKKEFAKTYAKSNKSTKKKLGLKWYSVLKYYDISLIYNILIYKVKYLIKN